MNKNLMFRASFVSNRNTELVTEGASFIANFDFIPQMI
jgi:hypothetical protein